MGDQTPYSRRIHLKGLEAGRGVAALLVVAYHTALHVEGDVGGSVLWHLPHFGHAGVDFFFVLSGFIITYVHSKDIGNQHRLAHYAERRVTRIMPFYWTLFAFIVAETWVFHRAELPGGWELVSNFLLLPQGRMQIVGGAWSLVFELLFYALFSVLIFNRKIGLMILGLWGALTVAVMIDRSFFVTDISKFFLSFPFCLEFFMGMGVAFLVMRKRIPVPATAFAFGVVAFLCAGVVEVHGTLNGFGSLARVIYGSASALIVAALVELERSERLKLPKFLATLGGASYSVYLVHLVAIGVAFHFISRLFGLSPSMALPIWAFLCVIGVACGVLASFWIEQPAIRLSRKLLSMKGRSAGRYPALKVE